MNKRIQIHSITILSFTAITVKIRVEKFLKQLPVAFPPRFFLSSWTACSSLRFTKPTFAKDQAIFLAAKLRSQQLVAGKMWWAFWVAHQPDQDLNEYRMDLDGTPTVIHFTVCVNWAGLAPSSGSWSCPFSAVSGVRGPQKEEDLGTKQRSDAKLLWLVRTSRKGSIYIYSGMATGMIRI